MASNIHPTAIIEDGAEIGDNVTIGPYCTIGRHVKIGDGTSLKSHIVIDGHTTIGRDNKIFPFTTLGLDPQHTQYKGEESTLIIGDRNILREHVSMHPGTNIGIMTTTIGNDGFFLAGTHIAHDCVVGNNVIMVNDSMAGGHVTLGDYAYIGANSAVKQWMRIGRHAMVSAMTGVMADIIPFGNVFGSRANLVGLNLIGLKRRGFDKGEITTIRRAYQMLFTMDGVFTERLEEVKQLYGDSDLVTEMLQFINDGGDNPLCHPPKE